MTDEGEGHGEGQRPMHGEGYGEGQRRMELSEAL